ncbi:NB-ARC domain-containing protein [Paeniglutamicibacter sulfureus]|uniref:NB-ARC domain-containing protein n=1 Tax=Paeniglutamicibacter sulfureus TaxID=43666 RepID=UPI0026663F0E|nr:NB-ARC domain-containing protein [Paeniglutamicibacter sulfureus]MDO2932971.1 NB-ARC domain-containing protein [Paeniglutamicibacter sulfureus]
MSSQQMYALIDAFERDIRGHLRRFIKSQVGDDAVIFGGALTDLEARRDADPMGTGADLVDYLDLRPAYDLLNQHRRYLPADLATQVRELTSELDTILPIRHRVMHSRPLVSGDFDKIMSSLVKFDFTFWRGTAKILRFLQDDDSWMPEDTFEPLEDKVRHNLPQSEHDETGLIGRDEEVVKICQTLKRKRDSVVTLCGEGGIGKTALAVEIAYTLLDDPEEPFDLVLWTSLKTERLTGLGVQALRDSATDLIGIANQLGSGTSADFAGGIAALAAAIEGFTPLIVIDNLETINGSDFVELYENLPDNASFLVTSREGIGQLERRIEVGPLSDKDALLLLNQMIRHRNVPALKSITGEARKNIVQKLRCSPLAIRWFILSTEAGKNPLDVIRHQDELLSYCVSSVYDNLSANSVEVFIAMEVLRRPVTPDDLVLLLGRSVADVRSALRELTRGALVRARLSGDSSLVMVIELTDTAREFTSLVIPRDHPLRKQVQENETTFLRDEERRAEEKVRRSLGPNVVRTRFETDAPTAQILRRALQSSKGRDYVRALELVGEAKQLNPEFWEVHRVEGFIHANKGDKLGARESYLDAYRLAETQEHKAVVAHYFAGLLARNLMEPGLAIPYAREAHEVLMLPDTASTLGTALVWHNQYDEGIQLLEQAASAAEGRLRLIATTALAAAYMGRASWSLRESRNPVQAAYDAICAYELASDELDIGAADQKLRETACQAANAAIHYLMRCQAFGHEVDTMPDFFDKLTKRLSQISGAEAWHALRKTASQYSFSGNQPYAFSRLLKNMELIEAEPTQSNAESRNPTIEAGDGRMLGTIHSLKEGFGFILTNVTEETIYFHKTGLVGGASFSQLLIGLNVAFSVGNDTNGRRRAEAVEVGE